MQASNMQLQALDIFVVQVQGATCLDAGCRV